MIMVKPALPYLDVLRTIRDAVMVPVAAYHVSGEYAAIQAAAANGWLDGPRAMDEALQCIQRAGADIIVTYAARDFAHRWRELHGLGG
jgi:porphobilinogen synthase